MLHIVTPLYRYHLLDQVYASLPPHPDVVWHVVKTSRRPPLDHAWIAGDPRVRIHEVDCDDADIVAKRNTAFDAIADGYFYLLDDDTVCLDEMYRVYREYSARGFVGMIVGASDVLPARMPTTDPALTRLDAGAVICHHGVLRTVRWAWSDRYLRDRYFWSRCFAHFGPARTVVVRRTIAAYNRLGPLVRVRKRVLGRPIAFDIHRPFLAWWYIKAADVRHLLRRWRAGAARAAGTGAGADPARQGLGSRASTTMPSDS
ncbi:MAG: hypothetical protein R2745_16840 [Vicinamibacterales bacterium]